MNFYISDLHFGCTNRYDGRTPDIDFIIKKNWNNVVTNADTVYILGDIGNEGTSSEVDHICQILSTLKGKKILIQGNHEKLKDIRVKQLFTEICQYKEISDNVDGINYKIIMSHYPILFWNDQHKKSIHLYGHVHKSTEWDLYKECLDKVNEYFLKCTNEGKPDCPEVHAFNVGCMLDYMDNTPKTLKQIVSANCVITK